MREGWKRKGYSLIYNGEANFKGRNGKLFILHKDARKGLIGFHPLNIRISIYE